MLKWLKSNCFAEEIPWKTTTTIWLAEVRERGHNHSRLVIPHAFWILIIAKWLNRNISSLSSSSLYNFLCSIHYIIRWVFVCVSTASTRRQPDHHIPKQRKKKSERCERKIIVLQLLAQNGFIYVSLRLRLEPIFFCDIDSFHNDNRPETNWPSLVYQLHAVSMWLVYVFETIRDEVNDIIVIL